MRKLNTPGVYIIRCKANNAHYVGATRSLETRLRDHHSKLIRGRHDLPLLQRDWDQYGQRLFVFLARPTPVAELGIWEEVMTLLTGSLEHCGGYNKMLGRRVWSLAARIRHTERNLAKKRRFCFRRSVHPDDAIADVYLRTFWREDDRTALASDDVSALAAPAIDPRLRAVLCRLLLAQFEPFDAGRG